MQFPTRATLKVAAVLGLVGMVSATALMTGIGDRVPSLTGTPALPSYNVADLESELQAKARFQARSDSDIEDEASRPIQQVVQVDRGDTLLDLLMRAGVEKQEANRAVDALREVYNPRELRAGQEVTVSFERTADGIGSGPFHAISLQPEAGRQVTAKRTEDDGFQAQEIKREVSRQHVRFGGTIKSSLFESAARQGVPASVLVEMIRALSYDVDFQRDIQPGDSFELMFERYADKKGAVVREGDVLFAKLVLSGQEVAIWRYTDSTGNTDYYNPKGESVRKALLKTPVDGARISSGFGMRRHPILGYSKMHKGIDFAVPTGTPIQAAGNGTVEFAGANGAYGYYVRVKHDDKHATAYAHMSRFAQGIRKGVRVSQGQVIGYVGSTGRSTGPHLHYEILAGGKQVNPLSVKFQSGTKLAGKELQRFQDMIKANQQVYANLPKATKVASLNSKGGSKTN